MTAILDAVGAVIWGAPMLLVFLLTALYFTFKSRFFQICGLKHWLKETAGSLFVKKTESGGLTPFGAFCSVLAACIGTGNIVGVATALAAGGPGTVFWMWLSAVFSMMTAYAENYLGIIYRRRDRFGKISGGVHSYIKNGVKMPGLAAVYAVTAIFSSLGMGNMAQANSVTTAINSGFGLPLIPVAAVSALLCFAVMAGGVKRIALFSKIAVPLMTAFYLVLSFWVLYKFKEQIPYCLKLIISEAFSIKAASGFGMYKAARFGISRGVFSNEAGLGSSTLLHAQTEGATAENQGMWAMFEVFCDTVLLCTVMALVILVSGAFYGHGELYGAALSVKAYASLGDFGKKSVAALTALFAFASLTGCSFYGEKSAEYLFGNRAVKPYRALYLVLAFLGGLFSPKTVWALADIFNGLLAVPNLFSLAVLRKEVIYPDKYKGNLSPKNRCKEQKDVIEWGKLL